jgi:hypothetical protein
MPSASADASQARVAPGTSQIALLDAQVLSCSLDGTIREWDLVAAKETDTWDVGMPVEDMVLYSPDQLLLSCHWQRKGARQGTKGGRIFRLSVCSEDMKPIRVIKTGAPLRFCASSDSSMVAAVERNSLHILQPEGTSVRHIKLHHTRHLTVRSV